MYTGHYGSLKWPNRSKRIPGKLPGTGVHEVRIVSRDRSLGREGPWNSDLGQEGGRKHSALEPARTSLCTSLPNSVFSVFMLQLEIGHRGRIYTMEIGKHYTLGIFFPKELVVEHSPAHHWMWVVFERRSLLDSVTEWKESRQFTSPCFGVVIGWEVVLVPWEKWDSRMRSQGRSLGISSAPAGIMSSCFCTETKGSSRAMLPRGTPPNDLEAWESPQFSLYR